MKPDPKLIDSMALRYGVKFFLKKFESLNI